MDALDRFTTRPVTGEEPSVTLAKPLHNDMQKQMIETQDQSRSEHKTTLAGIFRISGSLVFLASIFGMQ